MDSAPRLGITRNYPLSRDHPMGFHTRLCTQCHSPLEVFIVARFSRLVAESACYDLSTHSSIGWTEPPSVPISHLLSELIALVSTMAWPTAGPYDARTCRRLSTDGYQAHRKH